MQLCEGFASMYLNRAMLLILVLMYVLSPILAAWIGESGANWYRPQLLWLLVILIVALATVRDAKNET